MAGNEPAVAEQSARQSAVPVSLADSAVGGVRWMGLVRLVAEVLAFGGTVVLARVVPPAEFGYAAAALALAAIAPAFIAQTFSAPVIQFPSLEREQVQTAAFLCLVAGALMLALSPALAFGIAAPLMHERVADLFLLGIPVFAAAALGAVPQALLQRRLDFRRLAAIEIVGLIGGTATSVVLATVGSLDGEALVLGFVTSQSLVAVLSLIYAPRVIPRWRGRRRAVSLVGFGGPVGTASLLSVATQNIDYLVLSARIRPADVGFYWRAFLLGVSYQSKVSAIMLRVAFPVYSRAADADEMRRMRLRVMATHASLIFPMLATLTAVAPALIPFVFGERWQPSVLPTQILTGAGMIAALVTGTSGFITAIGRTRVLPLFNVSALVGLGATAYFAAPFGLNAVAASVVGYYVALLILNHYWLLHRVGGIPVRDLWRDAAPPFFACLPLAAVDFAFVEVFQRLDVPAGAIVVLVPPVGVVVYVAALRAFFPRSYDELRRTFARILGLDRLLRPRSRTVEPPTS